MIINMNDSSINRIEGIENFLNASDEISFNKESTKLAYTWVENTLVKFRYMHITKPEKGLVKKYIEKLTGYSRAQVTLN